MSTQENNEIDLSIDEILEKQVNIGRNEKFLSKGLEDRILFKKNKIVILDPSKILKDITKCVQTVFKFAKQGKTILFIDLCPKTSNVTREAAEKAGEYHCTEKWNAGAITNTYTIFKLSTKREEMKKILERDRETMRKKDAILLEKKINKITKALGGISDIKGRPDLVITIANKENYLPIKECEIAQVKKIEICDIDKFSLNKGNTERIVANVENEESLRCIYNAICNACLKGRRERVKTSTGTDFSKILERKKNLDIKREKGKERKKNDEKENSFKEKNKKS